VAGITRQRILGLETLLGLTAHVATLSLPQLLSADEVIICNSLYGAFQVTAIGDQTWRQQTLASTIRNILTYG